jgi:hypothetical protein
VPIVEVTFELEETPVNILPIFILPIVDSTFEIDETPVNI